MFICYRPDFNLWNTTLALNCQIPALLDAPCQSTALPSGTFNQLKVYSTATIRERYFTRAVQSAQFSGFLLTDFIQRDCGYLIWEGVANDKPLMQYVQMGLLPSHDTRLFHTVIGLCGAQESYSLIWVLLEASKACFKGFLLLSIHIMVALKKSFS